MKTIAEELKEIRSTLRRLFPTGGVTIDLNSVTDDIDLRNFEVPDYNTATEKLRSLGIGVRTKTILDSFTDHPWMTLAGQFEEGVKVTLFVKQLPPSCRLEQYVEKVPKRQTVDTGEFVEVTRNRVVCGQGVE